MKKFISLCAVVLFTTLSFSQIYEPVEWSTKVKQISENEYDLIFKGYIEDQWHIYSQYTPEGGPLRLKFTFEQAGKDFELLGAAKESETHTEFSEVFGVDEVFFSERVTLTQRIKVLNDSTNKLNVNLFYQVCKEVCLNESKDFVLVIKKDSNTESNDNQANTISENKPETKGLWATFLLAFFLGFGVLLTPCVFPMIPMTVSFFTKQSDTRAKGIKNAILYGIFIIVIYTFLGTVISMIFGSNAMYELSTGVVFNSIFFVVILLFAFSFLGAFEIMLPNSWMNKVDKGANKGGLIGIFFMALALAIVSFSCTFPVAGTALVDAATKGGIAPIISMLGFSLAIALPFTLFAIFPGWMNSLPKSGGWLNSVKVVLGFLELAFAFKFLSNVDLVLGWHVLTRELFLAIWIAIFGTLALYLFGKIRLPHDSPLDKISVGRLSLGLLVLTFTVYLIPGMWGAPLKIISGFPPPIHSHSESPNGVGYKIQLTEGAVNSNSVLPKGASYGPHNIVAFKNYDDGLAYAKKVGKPVFLDFTGVTCQNCRKMEENVWVDNQVLATLKNDVVLISLYVDDSKELPENEQYESKESGNFIGTYGQKWAELQRIRYNTNAQPLYVILDHDEEKLNDPVAYVPDADDYFSWLQAGLANFKK